MPDSLPRSARPLHTHETAGIGALPDADIREEAGRIAALQAAQLRDAGTAPLGIQPQALLSLFKA